MSKIVVVDGNSIMFRAYYATARTANLMQTSDGIYTNALYTFVVMLNKIMQTEDLTNIFIAFDKGKKTLRHQEYDDYKGTRKKMPSELAMQIPLIKEYLDILGINRLELDDYEADDIVGTVAFKSRDKFDKVDVISGDRDLLQLVKDNITVYLNRTGISNLDEYNVDNFKTKLGFTPSQLIDYKALVGDNSDNLPGVPGVGPVKATKLLEDYQTIENIYEHIEDFKGSLKENLTASHEQALKTKHLATIYTDAVFPLDIDSTKIKEPDKKALRDFFLKYELNSFVKKFNLEEEDASSKEELKETFDSIIKNPDNFIIDEDSLLGVEVELTENNYHHGTIIGLTLVNNDKEYYIEKDHFNDKLKDILINSKIKKVTMDSKRLIVALNKIGYDINNIVFDLTLASYLLDPAMGSKDYKDMIEKIRPTELPYFENIYGKKNPYVITNMDKVIAYSSEKLKETLSIYNEMIKKLEEIKVLDILYNMELPLARVLAEIEMNGFKVNTLRLKELGNIFNEKIKKLEQSIYDYAGHEFNIASPKQLGTVIFEEMCLAKGKKNKTGYSTAADVLEKLAKKHPFPQLVLDYRKYAKLVSTYINGLEDQIYEDGLVHTTFKQALTLTGRLSSVEPNIQNIPIRTEDGRLIRSAFVPRTEDGVLVSADYSQIELRVLASVSNCETMINEINKGIDFHSSTASKIFGKDVSEITKDERRIAKTVNFGIVYGLSAFGLAEDLDISQYDAQNFIARYFSIYPEIKNYLDSTVENCIKDGYTTTIFNRRRYIPEILSGNKVLRDFGKRTAMNAPIQGSAADIMKYAMIKVANRIKELNLKSKIVAQVHDELIIDCVKDEVETVKDLLRETMTKAVKINVRLDVDVETGTTWDLK